MLRKRTYRRNKKSSVEFSYRYTDCSSIIAPPVPRIFPSPKSRVSLYELGGRIWSHETVLKTFWGEHKIIRIIDLPSLNIKIKVDCFQKLNLKLASIKSRSVFIFRSILNVKKADNHPISRKYITETVYGSTNNVLNTQAAGSVRGGGGQKVLII